MALTRISRLAIVFGASLAVLGLMMASVDPEIQYSVDEIMEEPERFQGNQIFVRGVVSIDSMDNEEMRFILEGVTGEIFVDFTHSPIPDGFDEGRTIAVRGDLVTQNNRHLRDSNWMPFEIRVMNCHVHTLPLFAKYGLGGELTCSIIHKSSKMVTRSPRAAQTNH